jgi:hypothetical protein
MSIFDKPNKDSYEIAEASLEYALVAVITAREQLLDTYRVYERQLGRPICKDYVISEENTKATHLLLELDLEINALREVLEMFASKTEK